jgi:nitroreductase
LKIMPSATDQDNAVLDRIIGERRSCRRFTEEMPPDPAIEQIIHAGLHAPFAAAAIGTGNDYFRRFVVVRKGSRAMAELAPLVFNEVRTMAAGLEKKAAADAALREQAAGFLDRLSMITSLGMVPGVGTAPFYLVAAEKRGFPPVELQSLAHVMENMWLKATALGLGFQIVSVTAQMTDNPEFCRILGCETGKWAFMGCATGYAADKLSPSIRPSVKEVTAWLE